MSTRTNGGTVSPANSVALDRSSLRIVVMEKVVMHIAQPALPGSIKAPGDITGVRLASLVLSSIGFRRPTAQIPLMLSVETVCPGFTVRHASGDCRTKNASHVQSRLLLLRYLPVELSEGRCTYCSW